MPTPPLPEPHPAYGHHTLADGSRIYPSGTPSCPVRPGKFFLWVRTGYAKHKNKIVVEGEVVMDRAGVRYFGSAEAAHEFYRGGRAG